MIFDVPETESKERVIVFPAWSELIRASIVTFDVWAAMPKVKDSNATATATGSFIGIWDLGFGIWDLGFGICDY
jgi:hypothetical protein